MRSTFINRSVPCGWWTNGHKADPRYRGSDVSKSGQATTYQGLLTEPPGLEADDDTFHPL